MFPSLPGAVAEAQVEQLVDARFELSLQPSVLHDRPGKGVDQLAFLCALAQRRAAVGKKEPASCRIRGYGGEHVIGNGSNQQRVEPDFEGGARPRGLEPDRAVGRWGPQDRRPGPQPGLLHLARALAAGGGELLVQPRHGRITPRRRRPGG